jgi:dUTP pyrophosphatase
MEKIAKFEKVSFEEFKKSCTYDCYGTIDDRTEKILKDAYNNITLPTRGTKGSAGYDFITPFDICLKSKESTVIPTGIRCKINEGWVLKIYPRSSMGFEYKMELTNTVGIIDSDYYFSDNEGHIMIKITNDNNEDKRLKLKIKDRFAQGIFVQYGITIDDNVKDIRNGGIGSTNK